MSGRLAGIIFVAFCVILAILLLTKMITMIASGIIFAIVLVFLGLLSHGFRKK